MGGTGGIGGAGGVGSNVGVDVDPGETGVAKTGVAAVVGAVGTTVRVTGSVPITAWATTCMSTVGTGGMIVGEGVGVTCMHPATPTTTAHQSPKNATREILVPSFVRPASVLVRMS